jgi:hypothetical protein
VVVLTILAVMLYLYARYSSIQLPTGSHPVCFAFGVIAGLIIIFEALLWLRKKFRTWRIFGSPYIWMKLHIWLGLLSVPLALLHTGFYLGGPLSIALMLVFLLVIASGIYGLILQNTLPVKIFSDVPHETIYSQIDRIICLFRREAENLLRSIQPDFEFKSTIPMYKEMLGDRANPKTEFKANIVGARAIGSKTSHTISPQTLQFIRVEKEDPLIKFSHEQLDLFLSPLLTAESKLISAPVAAKLFADLRKQSDRSLMQMIDHLERLCNERREMITQKKLQYQLHAWLFIHYPLTVVLITLLFIHVIQSVRFW